ncbi:MAG: cytochrome c biogenesis protein DipZ [bacterium]
MILFLVSYISGVLTILAPCVLPVLPVILGSSATPGRGRAWRIIASFAVSIFTFTLLLKASTALIDIPPTFWKGVSATILIGYGLITLFPTWWERIMANLSVQRQAEERLQHARVDNSPVSDILVGAALGPVFTTCSPTYSLILATIFPVSFVQGVAYLLAYIAGFCSILALIAYFGAALTTRLRWIANPTGVFRKVLGILFILVGILIWTGGDKKLQTFFLDAGLFDITKVEEQLLNSQQMENPQVKDAVYVDPNAPPMSTKREGSAPEITGISQWLNTEGKPVTLAELKGKVVIVDFWTYSCINCQRTLPYLKDWYAKYADKGLVILGIHAPEFAFEHKIANVSQAVSDFGVTYPVGLDNDFATWRAYDNQYWPAKYFIDKKGNIRHEHFGEGAYDESERIIRFLLSEGGGSSSKYQVPSSQISSNQNAQVSNKELTPETYLGYERAEHFANLASLAKDRTATYSLPADRALSAHEWALSGAWEVGSERVTSKSLQSKLTLHFSARETYLVVDTLVPTEIKVSLNGVVQKSIAVSGAKLHTVASLPTYATGQLLELTVPTGVSLHAFTFGE